MLNGPMTVTFTTMKILLILIGVFQLSNAVSLICYKAIDNYQVATLDNPETLINSSCIDVSLETFLYAFGYRGTMDGNMTINAITACLNNSVKRNCLLLNWEKEASTDVVLGVETIEASYALKAVPNAISIGIRMSQVLIKLANNGLNLALVILVAHSLGCHLWGNTGRELKKTGKDVELIYGLDPAGPLFDNNTLRFEPLNANSSKFVYCLHTNEGNYGINSSECTYDIWPNYNHFINGANIQPGCPIGTYSKFTSEDLCSHNRAILLLVYALLVNNTSLEASRASNYSAWVAANGTATDIIYVGDLVHKEATPGNYYLTTNPPSDYGKGIAGLRP